MKWRPGKEEEEALTHPEAGFSTTSCAHKTQAQGDGSCSSLWIDGLKQRLVPHISAHGGPLLHWAPCAIDVPVLQLALVQMHQSPSPPPVSVAVVQGLLFLLRTQKDASPSSPGEAAASSAGCCRPAGDLENPGHTEELQPKGSLHPWPLHAPSMALRCHPSIAVFYRGFLLLQPTNTSFSEGAWLLTSPPTNLPQSSPLCQQLRIAMGPSHPKHL